MEALRSAPVRLPAGRLKLSTSPSATGSVPVKNTMGMSDVADLALAMAEEVQFSFAERTYAGACATNVMVPLTRNGGVAGGAAAISEASWRHPHPCLRFKVRSCYCKELSVRRDSSSAFGPSMCPSGGSDLITTSELPAKSLAWTPGDPTTTTLRMRSRSGVLSCAQISRALYPPPEKP